MEDRKVGVRIYGQDYTISGERDEQTIVEIAAYVDAKMREIGRFFAGGAQGAFSIPAQTTRPHNPAHNSGYSCGPAG